MRKNTLSPEGVVKKEIGDYLKQKGYTYFRMQAGRIRVRGGIMHLCMPGTADFLVCLQAGWNVWIECKSPKGITAKEQLDVQAAFRLRVEALGHAYTRCRSVEEVQQFLSFQHGMEER